MDSNDISNKSEIMMIEDSLNGLDPFDDEYPFMLLKKGLMVNYEQAEEVLEDAIYSFTKDSPLALQFKEGTKKGFRLVVDASDSTMEDIRTERVKLTTENSGKMYAQIREPNGRYGKKLEIKKEFFGKGIDPVQMATALQLRTVLDQLQGMKKQLIILDSGVQSIIQGQQDDRIGVYFSGLSLFLEAQSATDSELRRNLLTQSLNQLSEATYKLELNMKSDIKYLANKEYRSVKGNRKEIIDSKVRNIKKTFAYVQQSALLRAAIYSNEGEYGSAARVMEQFALFIENTISPNTNLLIQCDAGDIGTENGFWKSKEKLKLHIKEMTKRLKTPQETIYLDAIEENYDEKE